MPWLCWTPCRHAATTRSSCAPLDSILAPPPPPARETGLSGGAVAGIVVGVLAFVALLAAGGVLLARHAERKRKEEERRKLAEDIESECPQERQCGSWSLRFRMWGLGLRLGFLGFRA